MATIQDGSIYDHDGTTVGDPNTVAAYSGLGIDFDGATQYVTTPDSVNLEVTNLTIMGWVFSRTVGATQAIFCYWDSPYGYWMKMDTSNNLIGAIGNGASQVITGTPVPNNVWTHCAFTFDGTTLKLYQNGVLNAEVVATTTISYITDCQAVMGALSNDNGVTYSQWFDGILDEVRVYDRAYTQCEIIPFVLNPDLPTYKEAVATKCPKWYWQLDEIAGATVAERWGNGELTYGADASTMTIAASQADGLGAAKNMATTPIYDPIDPSLPRPDWTVNLWDYPFGHTYNHNSNTTTGTGDIPYAEDEYIYDYGVANYGNRWTTEGVTFGDTANLRIDTSHVSSRIVRLGERGGKYVVRWDLNSAAGGTSYQIFKMGFDSNMFVGAPNDSNQFTQFANGTVNYRASAQTSAGVMTAGDSCYVFIDFDNDVIWLNINNILYGSYPNIRTAWHSITATRSQDAPNRVSLDCNPSLSGITPPVGTVVGDWVGWNDWTQWQTEYNAFYMTNTAVEWNSSGIQYAPDVVKMHTGSTNYVSDTVVVPVTGRYIWIAELDHAGDGATTIQGTWTVDGATQSSTSANSGGDDAYDNNQDCGIVTSDRITLTAGQTTSFTLRITTGITGGFRNVYLVGEAD